MRHNQKQNQQKRKTQKYVCECVKNKLKNFRVSFLYVCYDQFRSLATAAGIFFFFFLFHTTLHCKQTIKKQSAIKRRRRTWTNE